MDDRSCRMECLRLVTELETMVVTDAETVVAAARRYYDYVWHGRGGRDDPDAIRDSIMGGPGAIIGGIKEHAL